MARHLLPARPNSRIDASYASTLAPSTAGSTLRLGLWCLGFLFLATSSSARAHISLEQAGTHKSRYGDDEIKDGPCGRANGKRGTNVYEYKPGETITIKVKEFIAHPGYFRIAFDQDGDDGFIEPRSIKPVDPARGCLKDGVDKCGLTEESQDFYNSDEVLMDNLDPHVASVLSPSKVYTWKVKLPDVECDNCTLQIIQVMEDTIHGPYSPKGASPETAYVEDIYHTCIDVKLKADATGTNNPKPPVATGDGDGDGKGQQPGGGAPASGDSGSCSVGLAPRNDSTLPVLGGGLALLAGWALVRRRRRSVLASQGALRRTARF
jgi:hypothetical protein